MHEQTCSRKPFIVFLYLAPFPHACCEPNFNLDLRFNPSSCLAIFHVLVWLLSSASWGVVILLNTPPSLHPTLVYIQIYTLQTAQKRICSHSLQIYNVFSEGNKEGAATLCQMHYL